MLLEIQREQEEKAILESKLKNYRFEYIKKQKEQINALSLVIDKLKSKENIDLKEILSVTKIDKFSLCYEVQKYAELDYLEVNRQELYNEIDLVTEKIILYGCDIYVDEFNGPMFFYSGTNNYDDNTIKEFENLTNHLNILKKQVSFIDREMIKTKLDISAYKQYSLKYKAKKYEMCELLFSKIDIFLKSHIIDSKLLLQYYQHREQILIEKNERPDIKFFFLFYNDYINFKASFSYNIWKVVIEYLIVNNNLVNTFDYQNEGSCGLITNSIEFKYKKMCINRCCFTFTGMCYEK